MGKAKNLRRCFGLASEIADQNIEYVDSDLPQEQGDYRFSIVCINALFYLVLFPFRLYFINDLP